MATKAELEAELTALRAMLVDSKAGIDATATGPSSPSANTDTADTTEGAQERHLQAALADLLQGDLAGLAKELTAELEDIAGQKPLLTTLGAFLLGYAIGRSR